jgi:hypothetical protein
LASDTAWKRNVGIAVSTVASIWSTFKVRAASHSRIHATIACDSADQLASSLSLASHGLII